MISFWPRSYWPNFLKAIYEASIRNSAWLRKCAYLRLSELSQLKMIHFCSFLSISGRFHTAVNTRWMWYESCLFVIGPWLANEQKELFDLFLIHEKSHSRNSSESEIARVRDWESALFSPVNKTGSERFLPDFFHFTGFTTENIGTFWIQNLKHHVTGGRDKADARKYYGRENLKCLLI